MGGLKIQELLVIFLILFLLFGATRLPQLGSSFGKAIRNFKEGFSGEGEGHGQQGAGEQQQQRGPSSLSSGTRVESSTETKTRQG